MTPQICQAADDAQELLQDLKPILEGHSVLTVMIALGELLAATLATDGMDEVTRESFVRSVICRSADLVEGPRLH